jgi:tetratricopeptide (TPR) repeat protein
MALSMRGVAVGVIAALLLNGVSGTALAAPTRTGGPSLYVLCDGFPNNASSAGTVARLVAITALVGLFLPAREQSDTSKRLSGKEGVDACTEVLFGKGTAENNPARRTELMFARAIHQIEAKNYDAAIADARLAAKDQPAFSATNGYRLSYGLSAIEIEVLAHLAAGKLKEMHAKALDLANAAPYDYLNLQRAARYLRLSSTYGAAEAEFFAAYIRLNPIALRDRADVRLMNGDIKGAAEDLSNWAELTRTSTNEKPQYALALAAVAHALAGNPAKAKPFADKARIINNMQAEEDVGTAGSPVDLTRRTLAFYDIVELTNAGKLVEARAALADVTDWNHVHIGTLMELVRRLRVGAAPATLKGVVAKEPSQLLSDELAARTKRMADAASERYRVIRTRIDDDRFGKLGPHVWTLSPSRYLSSAVAPDVQPRYATTMRDDVGVASGYALLLHTALVARAEGKTHFMVLPGQQFLHSNLVRIGSVGNVGLNTAMSFQAEKVIADLGGLFPKVTPK